MLDKFKQDPLGWHRLVNTRWPNIPHLPALDRSRIGVIRHRIVTHLDTQRRIVVAAAVALAAFGLGAVTVNAGEQSRPAAQAALTAELTAEREAAAQRADRGSRAAFALPDPVGRAAAAAASPAPAEEATADEATADEEGAAGQEVVEDDIVDDTATTAQAAAPSAAPAPAPDWVHPMPGARTTSCYGMRWGAMHAGVDLAAPHGTPIHAVGAGTVTHAGWVFGGYGISVVIDHHDGHYTHYAHASEARVSVGDKVEPGDVIALEGSTGDSTGPHLHFEVHKGGLWSQVEPAQWMRNRGVQIGGC